jgi:hypothetical protein
MVVGMFLHVWTATAGWKEVGTGRWWNENSKMAVTFTAVAVVSIVAFCAGHFSLYEGEDDGDGVE